MFMSNDMDVLHLHDPTHHASARRVYQLWLFWRLSDPILMLGRLSSLALPSALIPPSSPEVSINDMVTNQAHRLAVKKLEERAALATKGPRLAESPCPQSLFMAWGAETAASLINYILQRGVQHEQALVDEAWRELASMASVDGMLRATELSLWAQGEEQTQESELTWGEVGTSKVIDIQNRQEAAPGRCPQMMYVHKFETQGQLECEC